MLDNTCRLAYLSVRTCTPSWPLFHLKDYTLFVPLGMKRRYRLNPQSMLTSKLLYTKSLCSVLLVCSCFCFCWFSYSHWFLLNIVVHNLCEPATTLFLSEFFKAYMHWTSMHVVVVRPAMLQLLYSWVFFSCLSL